MRVRACARVFAMRVHAICTRIHAHDHACAGHTPTQISQAIEEERKQQGEIIDSLVGGLAALGGIPTAATRARKRGRRGH
jgi:hypothetical protein